MEELLYSIIKDLEGLDQPCVLILDEFQLITNPEIQRAIGYLLVHCPPSFHLVITSREEPPIAIARLRAQGNLLEIGELDLRFTKVETAQFVNQVMG